MKNNQKGFGVVEAVLIFVIAGLVGFVGWYVWQAKNNTNMTNNTSNSSTNNKATPIKTNNKKRALTCTDNETVTAGYAIYRNATYKYCIQYPTAWPVNQTDPARVILGTPTPEPAPGFVFVLYFSGKDVSTRTNEIQADYAGIGGPCTVSTVTIGGQPGKKLDCPTDSEGGNHIYFLVGAGSNLFELNYIEGEGTDRAPYDVIYNVMVGSFLTD